MFDPKPTKYPYPEYTDQHYLVVKKNDGTVFDKNYPYIDNSKSFRFKQKLVRILLVCIVFPMTYIRLGLKISGKKNLKKHKEQLKNGAISIANHVHMWDYLCVMNAIKPIKPYLLVWAPNVSGESGPLVRMVGGIPIPEHDVPATLAYMQHIEKLFKNKGWLHIYPEGSMWEFYQPIRPFKHGAAYFSVKFNKPIVPMAFSYRKPSWIRRKIFKQTACFNLCVGEPLFPDMSLSKKEAEIDLIKRSHAEVCRLAGINPEENIYKPIFNKSKRIDYYTDKYGDGYKGSW